MAKAGLPKLNLATKSISIKSSASSSLSGAQRCGISYGIMAQRSNTSIFSPKLAYSNSTSAMRHELNRKVVINNNMPPIKAQQDNGMSTMEKLMMFASMGSMATQLGKGIANTITELKGSDNNKSTTTTSNDGSGGLVNTNTGKSIKELQQSEKTINNKVKNVSTQYNNIGKTLKSSGVTEAKTNLQAVLSDTELSSLFNGLDLSKLDVTELNLTEDSSLKDIDAALKEGGPIDTDIKNIGETITKIDSSLTSVNEKLGDLKEKPYPINATPAQKAEIDSENAKIRVQIQKLQQAKRALEALKPAASLVSGQLGQQQTNLTQIRAEKAANMDAIYDKVKAHDEQIKNNNEKLKEKKLQIKDLDPKKTREKEKLIKEYNTLVQSNKDCVTEMNLACDTHGTVENSSGTPYNPTYLDIAIVQDYSDNESINAQGSQNIVQNGAYYNPAEQSNSIGDTNVQNNIEARTDFVNWANVNINNQGNAYFYNIDPGKLRNLG